MSTPNDPSDPIVDPVQDDEALMAAIRSTQERDEDEAATSLLAHTSNYSDHDSEDDEDRAPPIFPKPVDAVENDTSCVVCFEREPNVTFDQCGHANLCEICVSRLAKRRCPTCRARARKLTIRGPDGVIVTKSVRDIIGERKRRESKVLEDTLQVVFLGPEKVGKKTLVRKLISKFPMSDATNAADVDVFSDGTDFSANASIAGAKVRLTVLRRTTLTSRRMVLDDVRVLKPDVLVLCCSAHVGTTFETILSWDKILRNNFRKPRVWALITLDEVDSETATNFDMGHNVAGAINAIVPANLRPKSHYLCSPGEQFSIGFRSLAKDIVSMGRIARDEEVAANIALLEERNLADHEAAGTLSDQAAANLVIANNGIGLPSGSNSHTGTRGTSGARGSGVGRSFSLRTLRERGNHNGQGFSFSGIVNWLAGSHES